MIPTAFTKVRAQPPDPPQRRCMETKGDVPCAIEEALASVFEGEYRADYANHAQMEAVNSVAGGSLARGGTAPRIWCGTSSQPRGNLRSPGARHRIEVSSTYADVAAASAGEENRTVEFIVDSGSMSKNRRSSPSKVCGPRNDVHHGRFRRST